MQLCKPSPFFLGKMGVHQAQEELGSAQAPFLTPLPGPSSITPGFLNSWCRSKTPYRAYWELTWCKGINLSLLQGDFQPPTNLCWIHGCLWNIHNNKVSLAIDRREFVTSINDRSGCNRPLGLRPNSWSCFCLEAIPVNQQS